MTSLKDDVRRAILTEDDIVRIVNKGVGSGKILISQGGSVSGGGGGPEVHSGGTNFCPNSDFSYSDKAWTTENTPKDDPDPYNQKLYAVYRQHIDEDVSEALITVESEEVEPKAPLWDKETGTVRLGSTDLSDLWDVAIKFDQKELQPKETWYLRAALATAGDEPLPDGSIFYMGFWARNLDDSQGWVEGEEISIVAERNGIAGATPVEYVLVAKIGTGYSVKSAPVLISDGPDDLSAANPVLIEFQGTAGFTHLDLYRKRAGLIHKIAEVTNNVSLHFYDQGNNISEPIPDYPDGVTNLRAYSEVYPFVVPLSKYKSFSDFTIRIPNFDSTQVTQQGIYLRMGLKGPTTIEKQLAIDTVWAGLSYNKWSPSPNDNPLKNLASSLVVTGSPSTGTPVDPPPANGGGSTCVIDTLDLLLEGDNYTQFKNSYKGMVVNSGEDDKINLVEDVIPGETSQVILVEFEDGLVIPCTDTHRFLRSFQDGTGVTAFDVIVGDVYQGRNIKTHENIKLTVIEKSVVFMEKTKIRALKIKNSAVSTPYYAGGSGDLGLFVFFHNRKELPPDDQFLVF